MIKDLPQNYRVGLVLIDIGLLITAIYLGAVTSRTLIDDRVAVGIGAIVALVFLIVFLIIREFWSLPKTKEDYETINKIDANLELVKIDINKIKKNCKCCKKGNFRYTSVKEFEEEMKNNLSKK